MVFILEYIELYNIQNYKRPTKFKLSKYITIFSGRNNTGKTAIRRGMSLFAEPLDEIVLRGILRTGEDTGYCALYLDTGYKLVAILNRIKRKKREDHIQIRFEYIRLSDNEVIQQWNGHSDDILHILHWVKIKTKDETIVLNFKASGHHLFVDTPGSVNTMALNSLYFSEIYDRKITNLRNAINREEEVLVQIGQDAKFTAMRLQDCKYIDISYIEQVKDYYTALKNNIKTFTEQAKILTCLLEIERFNASESYYKVIQSIVRDIQLKQALQSSLLYEQCKEALAKLQKIIVVKCLQANLKQTDSLTKQLQVNQILLEQAHLVLATTSQQGLTKHYNTTFEQAQMLDYLQEITQITSFRKLLYSLINLTQKHSMLQDYLAIMEKMTLKNTLEIYQNKQEFQQKLQCFTAMVPQKLEKLTWIKILEMTENTLKQAERNEEIQVLGTNIQMYLRLQNQLKFLGKQLKLDEIASKIPTCPTCGKVYLHQEEMSC